MTAAFFYHGSIGVGNYLLGHVRPVVDVSIATVRFHMVGPKTEAVVFRLTIDGAPTGPAMTVNPNGGIPVLNEFVAALPLAATELLRIQCTAGPGGVDGRAHSIHAAVVFAVAVS